jgi:dTDP-4-dehydrorhamnose reductase
MGVLVTGCRGQLGAELCRQLAAEAVGVDFPEFDLNDGDRVRAVLESIRPQTVVNAAAFTLVDRAETEHALCRAINVEGVEHLARECRGLNAKLVQISTDYVFGGDRRRRIPYRETDAPAPLGVYALTKLESEQAAAGAERHLIVRTCGLFGRLAERAAGNFVETVLRLAQAGKSLRVVDDQRCTPTYTAHAVRAIRFLIGVDARGVYHVTGSGDTTWYDFAVELLRRADLETGVEPITSAEWGAPAERPQYSVLDCSKYHAMPGAPAMPPWQDALAEYLRERVRG